jgi:two-component system sensor histidine kinase KdpD
MGGTLEPEETPGGGLTMVLSLPAAPVPDHPGQGDPGRRERGQAFSPPAPSASPAAPTPPAAAEGGRLAT